MKLSSSAAYGVLLLWLIFFGCTGSSNSPDDSDSPGDPGMRMGLLQFRVIHNLQDDTCLPDQCNLTMEEETDTAAWLEDIAAISDLAVLHWDRPIPWLVFDEDPQGNSRTEFYDGRIDERLRRWIDAFADHFKRMPAGYLAVSLLSGNRDGIQAYRLNETEGVDVTPRCPEFSPGMQITFDYDPGGGPVTATFDLERSYYNFVMYLYDKLQPDYLALVVETNLYKEMEDPCPAHWDGLVQLYHRLYDAVRPQVDTSTKLFATLTLKEVLDYDDNVCNPLAFEPCDGIPSPPAYAPSDPATCYPLDSSAIGDLDQGNRLEILALSFYPDALLMDVTQDNLLKLYLEDWDGTGDCHARAPLLPYLDPTAALDRLNWTKPMAFAELGARSKKTLQFNGEFFVASPADLTSQSFWLDHMLTAARERGFEFYVHSFADDYPAIGQWTVRQGVLDAKIYSLFNNFAYMGLYDDQGSPKDGVTQTWLDALR